MPDVYIIKLILVVWFRIANPVLEILALGGERGQLKIEEVNMDFNLLGHELFPQIW